MTRRRLLGIATAIGLCLGVVVTSPAAATVSISTTAVKCSITARLPTLSKTKQLAGSASVTCLASASTIVNVSVQVVELDGDTVDRMNNTFIGSLSTTLAKSTKSVSWTVSTIAKSCINADGAGLEDYYTIATVSNGSISATERIGKIDGWNC